MAYDVTWDTETIPVANGAYASNPIKDLLLSQSQLEARTAIGAASSSSVENILVTLNMTKVASGGIVFSGGSAMGTTPVGLIGHDTEISFVWQWAQASPGYNFPRIISSGSDASGGWLVQHRIDTNSMRFIMYHSAAGEYARAEWDGYPQSRFSAERSHMSFTVKNVDTTPEIEWFIDGVSQGVRTPAATGTYVDSLLPLALARQGSIDANQFRGFMGFVQIYSRELTIAERGELISSGGQVVPISSRSDLMVNLPCDDGVGYQLRDFSGSGNHALLSVTGCTHLIPDNSASITASSVDASSAVYLLRSGNVLPANAIITGVIIDGEYIPPTDAQNTGLNRIRLAPSAGDLEVQRSNGTTHETLAVSSPTSLASVGVTILYQII